MPVLCTHAVVDFQSCCRFVRWSDGSLQLLVGDEVLDVSELDTAKDNNYLFLRHVEAQFLEVRHMHAGIES